MFTCEAYHMYAEVGHKANVCALGAVTRPYVSLWCSIGSPATLEQCSKGHIILQDASIYVICLINAALLRASAATVGTTQEDTWKRLLAGDAATPTGCAKADLSLWMLSTRLCSACRDDLHVRHLDSMYASVSVCMCLHTRTHVVDMMMHAGCMSVIIKMVYRSI